MFPPHTFHVLRFCTQTLLPNSIEHLFYFCNIVILVTNRLHIMRRDVFQAIADPHRRAILGLLAQQPLTLNGIAEHFAISRPAISKHVRILAECGVIIIRPQGRERYCEPQPDKLNEVTNWIDQYQQLWEQRFEKLDNLLCALQKKEQTE